MNHNPEWHETRAGRIGSSDAAAACGVSKWKSRLELYLEKKGELEAQPIDPTAAHWGTVLERTVAEEAQRRTGWKLRNLKNHLIHKKLPWMVCELDRHIVAFDDRGPGICECKTSSAWNVNNWGPDGSTQFPDDYLIQVQHQLAVTGWNWAILAVLIGGRDYRIYPVDRDEGLISDIIDLEQDLITRIETNNPPDPDFDHNTTPDLITRMYPGTDGRVIDLPAEAQHWHNVFIEARAQAAQYEKVAEGARAHLKHLVGGAAVGRLPDGTGYNRKKVKVKGYTVEDSEYISFKHTKKPKGGEQE
jgi:putative phage-type endonuclease